MKDLVVLKAETLRYFYPSNPNALVIDGVDLTLKKGQTVGLIGKNGTGKTTLLKLLSGILPLKKGVIWASSQPLPLIDIATGLIPEFSGRENIQFAYQFWGVKALSKNEFEKIVAQFSELGDALEKPILEYSTGMFARLAFSIITHIPAEVLLIDELIVAGDISFKRKMKDKLHKLKQKGVAMVLSSHNINELSLLCDHFMVMEKGKVTSLTEGLDQVKRYLNTAVEFEDPNSNSQKKEKGISILQATINPNQSPIPTSEPVLLTLLLEVSATTPPIDLGIRLRTFANEAFLTTPLYFEDTTMITSAGRFEVTITLPKNFLNEGAYTFDLVLIKDYKKLGEIKEVKNFRMGFPKNLMEKKISLSLGAVKPQLNWSIKKV